MKQILFAFIFVAIAQTSTITTSTATSSDVVVAFANETVTFNCEEHLEDHILWKKSVTQAITDDPNSMRHHVQHQNSKLLPYDVTQKKRHRRKEHGGDAKLILPDVEPDDSGVYSCHSLHRDRASIKTWTLIVLEASQTSLNTSLIFYNGAVLENGTVITVQEGDSVSLTCLQTLPNNSVNEGPAKWTVHGSKPSNSLFKMHSLTANFEEEHLGTHFDGLNVSVATRTILTDPFERSDDPLRYTCLSDDVIGGATFVDVDVVYPPTFTIRRVPAFGVPVIEGMRISMICEVERKKSADASGPKWLKDEAAINSTSDGVLTFERIASADIGWYQCSVTHDGEVFSSIGYFLNVKPAMVDNSTSATTRSVASHDDVVAGKVSYEERRLTDDHRPECDSCCIGLTSRVKDLQQKLEYFQFSSSAPRITPSENVDASRTVTFIICDFPENVFWVTPTDIVLRPGGASRDGFAASPIVTLNESCVIAAMTIESVMNEGDYVTLVAKNRHGMSDFVTKVTVSDEIVMSAEISSSHRHTVTSSLLLLMFWPLLLIFI